MTLNEFKVNNQDKQDEAESEDDEEEEEAIDEEAAPATVEEEEDGAIVAVAIEGARVDESYIATLRLSQLECLDIEQEGGLPSGAPAVDAVDVVDVDLEVQEEEEGEEEEEDVTPFSSRISGDQDHVSSVTESPQSRKSSGRRKQQISAVAEHISNSVIHVDPDLFGGFSTRCMNYSLGSHRAEFISATFHKSTKEESVGICVKQDEKSIVISSIDAFSLASDSPLREGDQIMSVNGHVCSDGKLSGEEIETLLSEAVGSVYVIVHNVGGSSDLVESMIMKETPDESLGLSIVRDRRDHSNIYITKISKSGKFHISLLHVQDPILSINGVAIASLGEGGAADMIRNSPCRITILAKTRRSVATVVAEVSTRHLTNSFVESVPELENSVHSRHSEHPPEEETEVSGKEACKTAVTIVGCIGIVMVVLWGLGRSAGIE